MVACESEVDDRPNIVFVLADDLGYGDLGSYGHPYALTPNLDRLAEEGTRFEHFYAASPLCIPSRAGFMTGVFPARFANYTGDFGLGNVPTITSLLNDAGYRTGHFGKWHLGAETSSGTYGIGTIQESKGRKSKALEGKRSRDSNAYDQAIRFIEKNPDGPFYVQIWGTVPHYPINPSSAFLAPFAATTVVMADFSPFMRKKFARVDSYGGDINEGMRRYLGDVHSIDFEMGRILKKLDDLGLSENTLVVFASDNGPGPSGQVGRDRSLVDQYGKDLLGSPGPFRGGKGSLYEGGARVPFIVRWPGHVPAGRVDDTSITGAVDWLPTLCGLAKISCASSHLDGEDVSSAWMGGPIRGLDRCSGRTAGPTHPSQSDGSVGSFAKAGRRIEKLNSTTSFRTQAKPRTLRQPTPRWQLICKIAYASGIRLFRRATPESRDARATLRAWCGGRIHREVGSCDAASM
jgi:arylsulfatase A-like enzyme